MRIVTAQVTNERAAVDKYASEPSSAVPRAMRHALLAASLLLLLIPPAVAQSATPTATARLDGPNAFDSVPARATAVIPLDLTLEVAGFACLQDTPFTVALSARQDSGAQHIIQLHPKSLTFTVPAGRGLAGYSQTVAITASIDPAPAPAPGAGPDFSPDSDPRNTSALLHVVAKAPEGGCPNAITPELQGDEAAILVTWQEPPAEPPTRAMPATTTLQVLAVFCIALIRLRAPLLNTGGSKV